MILQSFFTPLFRISLVPHTFNRQFFSMMLDRKRNEPLLSPPASDDGKFGNAYMRWTIVYGLIILVLTLMPIWLSFIIPEIIAYVNAAFVMLFALIWICIGFNAARNFSKLHHIPTPSLEGLAASRVRRFTHVVIVPCYIDPIDVLFDCLGSLMLQKDPQNLLVVVAFEAKTPDLLIKEQTVQAAFHDKFGTFLTSVHTIDKSMEIAGGCSNKNYALRHAHKHLQQNTTKFGGSAVTLTTCDTDSLFHPNYFTVLEACYNAENPSLTAEPRMVVWQPPLFYNWDLDQRPFFNRITGIMRSLMMLGGLISFNLNPMSIFSYPLEMGLKAGFINPRYGVDDIIAKVRWMCSTNQAVPVLLLPIPSISGPTIGTSLWIEVQEWSRQIRRWIVGSSESFHYFIIHWRGEPMFSGMWWFFMFFMYYAVLLCSAGIFTLLAGIPLPWVTYPSFHVGHLEISLKDISLIAMIIQYLVFGVGFIIDRLAIRLMTVKEDISIFRNLIHWILAPPTLLCYSIIAFYAIIKFMFVGKKMARHDMAAKDGLGANTVAGTTGATQQQPQPVGLGSGGVGVSQITFSTAVEEANNTHEAERRRSRSTSISKDKRQSIDGDSSGSNIDGTAGSSSSGPHHHTIKKTAEGLLCELPERFYFGQYSALVSEMKKIKRSGGDAV